MGAAALGAALPDGAGALGAVCARAREAAAQAADGLGQAGPAAGRPLAAGAPGRRGRRVVVVADSGFAVLELLDAVRRRVVVVTRLRLDARLFAPPPPRKIGRASCRERV